MTAKKVWATIAVIVVLALTGVCISSAFGAGPQPLVRLFHGQTSQSASAKSASKSASSQAASSRAESAGRRGAKDSGRASGAAGKKASGAASSRDAQARTEKTAADGADKDQTNKGTKETTQAASVMRTPIDWRKPSQTTAYPTLSQVKNLWIRVSIDGNRTYVMSGDRVIYTMYSSAGEYERNASGQLVSDTPTGVFHVEHERGTHFYSQMSGEGANWWVSWKDHGIYLFHSVPVDINGNYETAEADKLGKEPASHGCIRLSVPDAKWLYEQLPYGTKVVVEKK